MNERAPTIDELRDPATHAKMLETGDVTRYANKPVQGHYRQEIVDQEAGKVIRKPVVFWYQELGEGMWGINAQVGGLYKKAPDGSVFRDAKGKRKLEEGSFARLAGTQAVELWNTRIYPITREAYDQVLEGGSWPGVNAIAEADREAEAKQPQGAYASFKARAEALTKEAERILDMGPAQNLAGADQAGDLAGRIARLEKQGPLFARDDPEITSDMRETVERVRALAGRWKVSYEPLKLVVSRLKGEVILPFQQSAKAAAEARIIQARERGVDLPPETAKSATHVSGGGRTIGLRVFRYVRGFTDYAAALALVKDDAEVVEGVERACTRRLRADPKNPPVGCMVVEEERAV